MVNNSSLFKTYVFLFKNTPLNLIGNHHTIHDFVALYKKGTNQYHGHDKTSAIAISCKLYSKRGLVLDFPNRAQSVKAQVVPENCI